MSIILKEAAAMLDGREYLHEITIDEEALFRANGIVAVFGCSDDLMELRGAIADELGALNGTTAYFDKNGLFPAPPCGYEESLEKCPYYQAQKARAVTIEALWCAEGDYSWTYRTDIPHETFDILEDGGKYCRGIVFDISSIGGGA